jgi:hypothetical protein
MSETNISKSSSLNSLSGQKKGAFSNMVASLGKKLNNRAEPSELVQKNIIKGTVKAN